MKKTKKITGAVFAFLLAVVLLVPFTACGDKTGGGGNKPGKDPSEVEEYWVDRIEVTKGEGFQEDYADGEAFNTTGLIVKAYWNDGYIEESVPPGSYSVIPSVITEGVETVKIIYGDASLEIPISSAKIVGLTLLRAPTVSAYFVGEVFKADGIELGYLLDNGTTRKIPGFDAAEVTFPDTPFAIGDKEIEVIYGDYACKVPVTVKGRGFKIEVVLESDNVVMSGTEGYKEGTNEALKELASNGDFMQNFAIGSVMTFTFDSDTSQVDLLFQGSSTYVTKYGETITYAPVIVEDMQVSRVFDMTVNGRAVPISDQAILKGKRAEDGKTENVAYLANWTEVNLGIVDVYTDRVNTVSLTFKDNGYRNLNTLTGLLDGQMPAPYIDYLMIGNIEDDDTVKSIEITSQPSKTSYIEGQSFDRTGMVVTATHKDGGKSVIDYYNVIPSGPLAALGENEITVAYAECTDTVKVNVIKKVMTGIEITAPPDRTSYGRNQRFDPTGMVVKAKYNDGSAQVISDYTYAPDGVLTPSDTQITVTYNDYTDTVDIDVTNEDMLERLIVGGVPTAALNEGDDLPVIDSADVTVTAKYFSGREESLTSDQYTLDIPTGKAMIGSAVVAVLKDQPEITGISHFNVGKKIEIVPSGEALNSIGKNGGNADITAGTKPSGGAYVKDVNGRKLTIEIESANAGSGKIVLRGSSTATQPNFSVIDEMLASDCLTLTVNGKSVAVPDGMKFIGKSKEDCAATKPPVCNLANWCDLVFEDIDFIAGTNKIEFDFISKPASSPSPYLDTVTVQVGA